MSKSKKSEYETARDALPYQGEGRFFDIKEDNNGTWAVHEAKEDVKQIVFVDRFKFESSAIDFVERRTGKRNKE
jgi:hypothetical protein